MRATVAGGWRQLRWTSVDDDLRLQNLNNYPSTDARMIVVLCWYVSGCAREKRSSCQEIVASDTFAYQCHTSSRWSVISIQIPSIPKQGSCIDVILEYIRPPVLRYEPLCLLETSSRWQILNFCLVFIPLRLCALRESK